jgi:short-subunit dehydrogenase
MGASTNSAIQVDLARDGGVDELWRTVSSAGRPLEAAALNAGIGAGGPFAQNDLDKELHVVDRDRVLRARRHA